MAYVLTKSVENGLYNVKYLEIIAQWYCFMVINVLASEHYENTNYYLWVLKYNCCFYQF